MRSRLVIFRADKIIARERGLLEITASRHKSPRSNGLCFCSALCALCAVCNAPGCVDLSRARASGTYLSRARATSIMQICYCFRSSRAFSPGTCARVFVSSLNFFPAQHFISAARVCSTREYARESLVSVRRSADANLSYRKSLSFFHACASASASRKSRE